MHDELKFKIYNKISKKCFKVTRIDYIEKQVYYYDKDEEETISFNDCQLLMPTGIYDSSNREIYEGDVITYQSNSLSPKKVSTVIYENGCFMTKLLLSKQLEARAKKDNIDNDIFTDLLFLATTANYKPIKIIGNIFTYNYDKNSKKAKTTKRFCKKLCVN